MRRLDHHGGGACSGHWLMKPPMAVGEPGTESIHVANKDGMVSAKQTRPTVTVCRLMQDSMGVSRTGDDSGDFVQTHGACFVLCGK